MGRLSRNAGRVDCAIAAPEAASEASVAVETDTADSDAPQGAREPKQPAESKKTGMTETGGRGEAASASLADLCKGTRQAGCAQLDSRNTQNYTSSEANSAVVAVARWTLAAAEAETAKTNQTEETDNELDPEADAGALAPDTTASLLM